MLVDGVLKMDFLVPFYLPFTKKKYFNFSQSVQNKYLEPTLKLELDLWIPRP